MPLRHLVVGSGNMGRRHGDILMRLGDFVEYVDIGFDPQSFDYDRVDSVLICTPPETHAGLCNSIIDKSKPSGSFTWKPVFIEKPIISRSSEKIFYGHPRTMVACNWRWCGCVIPVGDIMCGYPINGEYAWLDQIHFLDIYWERYGRPKSASISIDGSCGSVMRISGSPSFVSSIINFQEQQTWFGSDIELKRIHRKGHCDMFLKQMEVWRDVCMGKTASPNPIDKAYERTSFLIDLASAGQGADPQPV